MSSPAGPPSLPPRRRSRAPAGRPSLGNLRTARRRSGSAVDGGLPERIAEDLSRCGQLWNRASAEGVVERPEDGPRPGGQLLALAQRHLPPRRRRRAADTHNLAKTAPRKPAVCIKSGSPMIPWSVVPIKTYSVIRPALDRDGGNTWLQ